MELKVEGFTCLGRIIWRRIFRKGELISHLITGAGHVRIEEIRWLIVSDIDIFTEDRFGVPYLRTGDSARSTIDVRMGRCRACRRRSATQGSCHRKASNDRDKGDE